VTDDNGDTDTCEIEVEIYDAWTFDLVKRIEANTPSAVSNIGNRIEERGL